MSEFMKDIIGQSIAGPLSRDMAMRAFNEIMSGNASQSQVAGFLIALKMRGETVNEIASAAKVMLSKCTHVKAPDKAIDIVGTGGDGKGTLNISTATALVVASSGVVVAKHGNRNISSKSGAADVLEQLNVNLTVTCPVVERCLRKANIGFMLAPTHHPAVRHVMSARKDLGTRTIFNILGPLTNPASTKYHLIGTYSKDLLSPMTKVLKELGSKRAWLVHGADGTDEISISGTTHVLELKNGQLSNFKITPKDAGLTTHPIEAISGGSPKENAKALRELIAGKRSPYRDTVLLNAAAALIIANKVENLIDGVQIAANSIDSGATEKTLNILSKETQVQ